MNRIRADSTFSDLDDLYVVDDVEFALNFGAFSSFAMVEIVGFCIKNDSILAVSNDSNCSKSPNIYD